MPKVVYVLTVVGVVFATVYVASVLALSASMEELAYKFTLESLRLQVEHADSVKSVDIPKVYVFDNVSYFKGAMVTIRNDVRVKTKDEKFAVLSETAQEVMDMDSYKEFSAGTMLKQDEIGYYI